MRELITKQDWQLFREKFPNWQEAYMERLNREYAAILAGEGRPSEKFWTLEKRIKADKKRLGVSLEVRKSELVYHLAALINDGVIAPYDLAGFSDDLVAAVRHFAVTF